MRQQRAPRGGALWRGPYIGLGIGQQQVIGIRA
ncbi:hypothetical protein SXANM310S_07298 [Streptomyces xanthochromogenes]